MRALTVRQVMGPKQECSSSTNRQIFTTINSADIVVTGDLLQATGRASQHALTVARTHSKQRDGTWPITLPTDRKGALPREIYWLTVDSSSGEETYHFTRPARRVRTVVAEVLARTADEWLEQTCEPLGIGWISPDDDTYIRRRQV
jgi:hypothetical protein